MRYLGRFSAAVATALGIAGSAGAQQVGTVITGRVMSVAGVGVEAATVVVQGTSIGTQTNTTGGYTLRVPADRNGQTVTLVARRVGFQPRTAQAALTSGTQTVNFTLAEQVSQLDEVVVTGVAEATSLRNTTISISKVSEAQIQQVPPTNPVSALAGKVPGVMVATTTGAPGSAPAIRLRGSTNLGIGGNEPLVLVDGVITKNGLADIDGNDIESIEVLKGAASANTYGSDAANGVIAITTKRGHQLGDDKTRFTARSEFGKSQLGHVVPQAMHHQYALNPDGSIQLKGTGLTATPVTKPDHILDNPYTGYAVNQLETWAQNGNFTNNYFNLSARRGGTNFSGSVAYNTDQGILPFRNGYRRNNTRLNVDQILSDKLDVSVSTLYGLSNSDVEATQAGNSTLGTFFQLLNAPPNVNLAQPNPDSAAYYYSLKPYATNDYGNPLYLLRNEQDNTRNERIVGSGTVRFRPLGWLTFDGTYGTDRLNTNGQYYQFRGGYFGSKTPQAGYLEYERDANTAQNSQVNATASGLFGGLHSTTRLTYLYEDQSRNREHPYCTRLSYASVVSLANCDPTQITLESSSQTIRSKDAFVTQSFNYNDRYLAQLLLRRDESSLFGANTRSKTFYGVSGAWRVTQDFAIPHVEDLKIRAARGTAGLRPAFADQYERYALSAGGARKEVAGNPNLEPAVQLENEVGVTASFLNHFDLDVTGSRRRTTGAFLEIPLSSAQSGGYTSQVQNAATVSGRTFELALNTRVVDNPQWGYNFTLTGSRTRQYIDELNRPPYATGNTTNGSGQNVFWYRAGEALGVIYGDRWVHSLNELLDNPANTAANGFDINNYVVNQEGYVVNKADIGTLREAPLKYVNPSIAFNGLYKIADVNPDYIFGLAQTLRYGGFQVYGLLDGSRGGQVYNYNKLYTYINYAAADFDQSGKAQADKKPYDYYSVFYNAQRPSDRFIEDGSFVKLRELSVSYTFSDAMLNRLQLSRYARGAKFALIGRNLHTWTKYTGFDPEAASDNDPNFRVDAFRYPPLRQITGQFELTF